MFFKVPGHESKIAKVAGMAGVATLKFVLET